MKNACVSIRHAHSPFFYFLKRFFKKNKKIVKLLKKHGADKNAIDSEGKKPKEMFKPKKKKK